jgi:twitching motility protein PilT
METMPPAPPPPPAEAAPAAPPAPAAPEIAAPPPPGMQIAAPPPAPAPIEEVAPPPAPVIADPAAAPPPVDNAATEIAPPAPAVEAPEPAPAVEEAPAEPAPEQLTPQTVPLAERDRDPKGGILLTEDEDISLRYPAGMLLKSDETSECWNGLEEDKSIKDDDLRLFDLILQDAINEDVADLHIKEDHYIHFRMSRGLRDRDWPKPTRKWIERVIFHMCPEHFVEQFKEDRETDFSYFDPKFGRFRVNVFSQCSKWALAMRYVKNDLPPIEKLGIHPICLQLAEAKRGLTLLAGITGSGKSTTMAAMVMHLNKNFRKHIITIEDPVEMVFEDEQCVIEQREVGLDTMSFQRALKSALREDPDMVLVGEMRDATSIGAAMRAADTGAMVLSTVHTRTASSVPGRLLDFFPEEEREMQRKKYAEVIVGAVAQRMCPTIDGGMCPAQEVMIGTPLVKQKIFDGELNRLEACINASEDDGMFTFNRCMYNLVEEGKITKEIALANATNPQQLEMWFQGIEINTGIV